MQCAAVLWLLACAGRVTAFKDVPRRGLLPRCPNPAIPGKSWLSPWLPMTEVLADCCRFTSSNPRQTIGSGLEDYQGANSDQMGLQWSICYCLLLFSCLNKTHSELWPGLRLLICKALTILCSSVCNHLHFGIITA